MFVSCTGHNSSHDLENGGSYLGHREEYARNDDDDASAVTEGASEAEYDDSAGDPHGPQHQAAPLLHHNMQSTHNHYAPAEQDVYEEEREDTSSEGTR